MTSVSMHVYASVIYIMYALGQRKAVLNSNGTIARYTRAKSCESLAVIS
jgi:hypothetical protein